MPELIEELQIILRIAVRIGGDLGKKMNASRSEKLLCPQTPNMVTCFGASIIPTKVDPENSTRFEGGL
jgi:hypothetical protein